MFPKKKPALADPLVVDLDRQKLDLSKVSTDKRNDLAEQPSTTTYFYMDH